MNTETIYYNDDLSDDVIVAAWKRKGQGHKEAVGRGKFCVVVQCNRETAIKLSRKFIYDVFAIPTCAHYDGKTLSLFCGGGGHGTFNVLDKTKKMVDKHLKPRQKPGDPIINSGTSTV